MRIVSLAPSATELVFALGCGDQLLGRTAFCDYPQETQRIPALGGWTTADVESVAKLKPDLVFTSTFLQDSIVAVLRERRIPVCHTDPRTLADVLQSFETTAAALGIPDRGRELRVRVESQLVPVSPILVSPALRVYAEEWPEPPMASGNWVPDLLAHAGGISLLSAGERSRTVSVDEVQAFDPDVIVLNYCGMEHIPSATQIARVTSRKEWNTLRAARAGRIMVIPDSLLNRPGPRLLEGFHALVRCIESARATHEA